MPKFNFKYKAVKKYREHRLLLAKRELARVEASVAAVRENLRNALQERSSEIGLSGDLREHNFGNLSLHADLVSIQNKRIAFLNGELAKIHEELDRHLRWVAQLGQELRIIEKLEEKQNAVFEAEQKLLEKRRMDRWVAEHWDRGSK